MALLAATNRQVPDQSILDHFDKQTYLGNQYTVSQSFTIGSSETVLILLQNAQTGNAQILKSLFQNLLKVSSQTASQSIILNAYFNPTFSAAGTSLTPSNSRISYGNNAVATATYTPTVSNNGTLIDTISAAALSVSSSQILHILDNTENLLITGIASASSTAIDVILGWYEL
jgi:hypothetical protein